MTIKDYADNNSDFLKLLDDPDNIGMKNIYEWLMTDPPIEEIEKFLPFIENMGKDENEVLGMDKLDETAKKRFIQHISFSNFIYKAALEKILKEKNDLEISKELFDFRDYENIFPTKAYFPNSKLSNELINISKDSLEGYITKLNIAGDKKEPVNINAYFDFSKIEIMGEPLTPFDLVVLRAICTLWEAGKQAGKNEICFNLQQVYRAINGTADTNINYDVLALIKNSIEKGLGQRIIIDCTEQLAKWKKGKKPKKAEYETYLLPLDRIKLVMKNGEKVEGYKFFKMPPLYAYSQDIGQVLSVDIKLLETNTQGIKYRISNTQENIILRDLLIKRIGTIKNSKQTNKINYENLFKSANIDTDTLSRVQIKRKRESIKNILEHFKKEKYIKGYEEYKEGQKITGLTITF